MKTNNILDLATVYATLSIQETLTALADIKESKETLDELLILMKADSSDMETRLYHISCIEEQIDLANKNIRVLENAIMCHETKIFEKRTLQDKTTVICLN
jgi:hypothetical protein